MSNKYYSDVSPVRGEKNTSKPAKKPSHKVGPSVSKGSFKQHPKASSIKK